MIDKKAIGKIIKNARKNKKLNQFQLSTITELSRSYISDIENGRYAPSIESLSKIAVCLDIDLNLLKEMTEIQGYSNAV